MARVTVEDCVTRIPNRFELVLLATQRSRELSGGAEVTVERENDRNPVIALREIAGETVVVDELRQALITSLQKRVEIEGPEDDGMEILAAAGKDWAEVTGGDGAGTDPTGPEMAAAQAKADAKPTATAETDEKPTATAKTDEEPTATAETDEEPTATAETDEEPTATAETDAEPTSTAETAAEAEDERPDTAAAEPAAAVGTVDGSGEEKSEPREP